MGISVALVQAADPGRLRCFKTSRFDFRFTGRSSADLVNLER